jgi:CubicO group peptidase (beta-lactamase class C family)
MVTLSEGGFSSHVHGRTTAAASGWFASADALAPCRLIVAAGIAVASDRKVFSQGAQASRPDLQRILDGLVTGPGRVAPGVTAYVSGPHSTWLGSTGVADTSTGAQMPVDARMRLENVSKIYTATLILQLAQEGTLRVGDAVARLLPGLLPYGNRITIRELLTMRSGLIDNNDLRNASENVQRANPARVKDARLRAQLLAIAARINKNPATEVSPSGGSGSPPGSRTQLSPQATRLPTMPLPASTAAPEPPE